MQSSKERQGEIRKRSSAINAKKQRKTIEWERLGFPGGSEVKASACNVGDLGLIPVSDQCKEIEENNRMGKTRDLFKKIRDTKGTFHAKMGSIRTEMVWT